jgi:hypothetical protein
MLYRFNHGTSGLIQMLAIVKPAATQMRAKFDKGIFQLTDTQVGEPEFLKAR